MLRKGVKRYRANEILTENRSQKVNQLICI